MFTRTLRLFSIMGIPVEIHASWFIVLVLVTWSFATGYYPQSFPDTAGAAGLWFLSALTALLLFASILLHELSHSVVARRGGVPIRGITLFMFGGVAQMDREADEPGLELRMAAAGPLMTLLLIVVFHLAARRAAPTAAVLLETVGNINIAVLIFNLVPGFPLDGGRILRAAIWRRSGNMRRATRAAAAIGTGFAWLLVGGGALNAMLYGNLVSGAWLVLIGLFLRQAARNSYRQVVWRQSLAALRVGDVMRAGVAAAPPSVDLEQLVRGYLLPGKLGGVPVAEDGRLIGMVFIDDVRAVERGKWNLVTAGELAAARGADAAPAPDDPAWALYPLLARDERGVVPVVDRGGRLAGVVSGQDVSDLIRLRVSLER